MVERLITRDRLSFEKKFGSRPIYQCTKIGLEVLENYLAEKEKALESTQKEVFKSLQENDIETAYQSYEQYFLHWDPDYYNGVDTHSNKWQRIISFTPKTLSSNYSPDVIKSLRALTGLLIFWPTKVKWELINNKMDIDKDFIEPELFKWISRHYDGIEIKK